MLIRSVVTLTWAGAMRWHRSTEQNTMNSSGPLREATEPNHVQPYRCYASAPSTAGAVWQGFRKHLKDPPPIDKPNR
eukprot:609890-Pyramimonas_sp.AAC.1